MLVLAAALAACGTRGARADLSAQVASFDAYAIMWLGPSYDVDFDGKGDSITFARPESAPQFTNPVTGEVLVPARRSYSISYGTCEIPAGAEGCPIPLTMVFEAPCEAYPLSDVARNGTMRVRGVDDVVSVYLVESIPDDSQLIRAPAGAPTPDVSHPSAGDTTATYVRSTSSTLYFTREGSIVAIRDRSGKSDAAALQAVASALSEYPPGTPLPGTCCALQLDMDPAQPGVQSSLNVSGPQDITVGVVFGDNAGELNAFNFTLVYDDTRLTPIATGAGGTTDGNPDFDDAALGNGWTCSLPSGSATPDTDPATGPGHGVAFLSCFTTGAPASIAAETEVATLRLRVAASGTSNVVIREAAFFHPEQIEIGSCQPVISVGIACVEGTVTAP